MTICEIEISSLNSAPRGKELRIFARNPLRVGLRAWILKFRVGDSMGAQTSRP